MRAKKTGKRSNKSKKSPGKSEDLSFDASRSDFRLTIVESLAACERAAERATSQYHEVISTIEREATDYMRMLRVTKAAEDCDDKIVRYNIGEGKLGYVINDKPKAGFQNGSPRIIDLEVIPIKAKR